MYKRQVLCNKGGKVCGAAGGVSGKQDGVRWACPDRSAVLTIDAGNSTGAVSYTHLDVYKRQGVADAHTVEIP